MDVVKEESGLVDGDDQDEERIERMDAKKVGGDGREGDLWRGGERLRWWWCYWDEGETVQRVVEERVRSGQVVSVCEVRRCVSEDAKFKL